MRDEECDWCTYHLIATEEAATIQDLTQCTGLSHDIIEASVKRLIRARLIEKKGEFLRFISIPEMIILQEAESNPDSPFVIEDGVIRIREQKGS